MRYPFPENIDIEEVRVAIANHNARLGETSFIEADRGDHVIFNYLVSFAGSFPEPMTGDPVLDREYAILRECRGMTFTKSGRLVSRKYSKFFNINEKDETQAHLIDFSKPHVILEKLDGSMITPYFGGDSIWDIDAEKLEWHTKMGRTDVAANVEAWVTNGHTHYARWAATVLAANMTPMFEWCSRKNRIVIDYAEDRLVLTAVRNNATGEYLPYSEVQKAALSDIEVVRALPGTAENIELFMKETTELEDAEGYVICFDDGHRLKVKGAWYCQIHKVKDSLTFEKDVLAMVTSENYDDVSSYLVGEDVARVERFRDAVLHSISAYAAKLESFVAEGAHLDQKAFATEHVPLWPNKKDSKFLFGIRQGRDARDTLTRFVHERGSTSSTAVDEVRYLIGGHSWYNF